MNNLAAALGSSGACGSVAHSEAALTVLEVEAATLRRFWPHTNLHVKDAILRSESNAATVKHNLGNLYEQMGKHRQARGPSLIHSAVRHLSVLNVLCFKTRPTVEPLSLLIRSCLFS